MARSTGSLPARTDLEQEKASVVFDPEKLEGVKPDAAPKYIWDLAFGPDGALYIATGGPAAVYRVSAPAGNARAERFFQSDEQHIRALLFEKDGNLLAGSDGDGLVYRIDKAGKGFILFNAPKREVTALTASAAGQIYVATVGEKGRATCRPCRSRALLPSQRRSRSSLRARCRPPTTTPWCRMALRYMSLIPTARPANCGRLTTMWSMVCTGRLTASWQQPAIAAVSIASARTVSLPTSRALRHHRRPALRPRLMASTWGPAMEASSIT